MKRWDLAGVRGDGYDGAGSVCRGSSCRRVLIHEFGEDELHGHVDGDALEKLLEERLFIVSVLCYVLK